MRGHDADTTYGLEYARLYREHWWWRGREAILLRPARRVLAGPRRPRGPGRRLRRRPVLPPARARSAGSGGSRSTRNCSTRTGPYRDRISTRPLGDPAYRGEDWRFDLITALDVIEHIDDDRAAVAAMAAMLRPGGLICSRSRRSRCSGTSTTRSTATTAATPPGRSAGGLEGQRVGCSGSATCSVALFPPKLLVKLLNLGRSRKVAQHALPSPAAERADGPDLRAGRTALRALAHPVRDLAPGPRPPAALTPAAPARGVPMGRRPGLHSGLLKRLTEFYVKTHSWRTRPGDAGPPHEPAIRSSVGNGLPRAFSAGQPSQRSRRVA